MKKFVLVCVGEACPTPLMKVEKIMNDLEKKDMLFVTVDHMCAMKDIPEWAIRNGYNLETNEADDGEWEIKKKKN
ncbi:MAG: sulfurtransferase TusA family protein [Clostridia bacterium]|nr:sulfurtransferase TusA family protein [Clostridia bacterium]